MSLTLHIYFIYFSMYRQFRHIRNLQRYQHRHIRRVVTDRSNPFHAMTEEEFLMRFRLSKECTLSLIAQIEHRLPHALSNRGCPVPFHLQVLIGLRYIATGNDQLGISDWCDVSQSFVSRCVVKVAYAIGSFVWQSFIKFPDQDNITRIKHEFMTIAGMPGVIGCIDCTHIAIEMPSHPRPEVFRNRKGYFSFNVQAVCGPQLQLYNIVARWPGSAHDSNIFENSRLCQELEDGILPGHLLGDSGHPCREYLLTPLTAPHGRGENRYNASHIRTRNSVERAFGLLKRRFACLGKKMRTSMRNTKHIIVAAAVLHNLAIAYRVPEPDNVIHELHDPDDPEAQGNIQEDELRQQPQAMRNIQGVFKRQQIIREYFA
ncbi:putative nuclease HARBI1 [Macrobrachium nipponense]|uniref:putative nuclease HARBI1 n=1 Tax=Macrobrachium nipponense TaxID=159736 RepID=UPI0030C87DFD